MIILITSGKFTLLESTGDYKCDITAASVKPAMFTVLFYPCLYY